MPCARYVAIELYLWLYFAMLQGRNIYIFGRIWLYSFPSFWQDLLDILMPYCIKMFILELNQTRLHQTCLAGTLNGKTWFLCAGNNCSWIVPSILSFMYLIRFPIFFPLRKPIYVPSKTPIEVHFWRCCGATKVLWFIALLLIMRCLNTPYLKSHLPHCYRCGTSGLWRHLLHHQSITAMVDHIGSAYK